MQDLFFRNRRLLALAICLILVAGSSAYYTMPRMEDPQLVPRAATVTTLLPGRDAKSVETLVTKKLEDAIYEIEEIKEVRSASRPGVSFVMIELRDDVKRSETVWARIRDKIEDANPVLPSSATQPRFDEMKFKAFALITSLTWEQEGPPNYGILRRTAEELKDLIKLDTGTEEVKIFGDPEEEIVVKLDQQRLISMGLTADRVAKQIAGSDAKVSAGQLRNFDDQILLEIDSQFTTIDQVARIPIQTGNDDQIVLLSDVARIEKGIRQPPSSLAIVDGKPSVSLGIYVRNTTRIDHWSQRMTRRLEDFSSQLPRGIELKTVFRQNDYVASRLSTLVSNLMIGGLAVTLVILIMMGWRNAIVVATALPLSASMVLAGMKFLNIPIHQMSVTGLIIALGLLIDNAIVIVDEVSSKMHAGKSAREAIGGSVRHLAIPLFGSTLTTALAFGPIALMPGPAGEFVGSIAISVILAVGSSFILAMTVIPALAGILTPDRSNSMSIRTTPQRWWQSGISIVPLRQNYERMLQTLFRRPLIGVGLGVLLPFAGFLLSTQLSEQFFPPADRDQVQIEIEMPAQSSLSNTLDAAHRLRASLLENPRIESVDWFLGESAPSFYYNLISRRTNNAQYAQALVGVDSSNDLHSLIAELQNQVDREVPEARVLVRQLEQGPPFDAPIEIRLFGPDLRELKRLGDEVRGILAGTPGVIHTRSELSEVAPKISFVVDEEQAELVGLDPTGIAHQLSTTLEGALGGSVLEGTEELPIRVRVDEVGRSSLDEIMSLNVLPMRGQVVPTDDAFVGIPLATLVEAKLVPESATITHLAGMRMNELQAYIPAGVLPADVLTPFQQRLKESNFELPPGYQLTLGGEAAKRDEAVGNLFSQVGVLAVLMVATLVLSFGSFRLAMLIGSVAALSVGLGTGALWVFGFPFGFMAIVGTMGLIGVAINDTIVVLAAIRADKDAVKGDSNAVARVVVRSTRHIVSTSLTTMAGFTPLVLSGGGFWPPLAITIAGGVGGATILALIYSPSVYVMVMCRGRCRDVPSQASDRSEKALPPLSAAAV